MNDNTNKQAVIAAIWENPAPAFGVEFRQSGRFWENQRGGEYDERGKIRLAQTADGSNITVFYNGASRPEHLDVFSYLSDYVLNTGGFADTLRRLAEIYGVPLRFTEAEREKLTREALAAELAPSLIEALRQNPDGPTATYLRDVRGLAADGVHFGELTEASIARAVEHLRNRGKTATAEDLAALGLTADRARQGYNLAIPYYRNGRVVGLLYRNVKPDHTGPKYLISKGTTRAGYCDRLTVGEPVTMVEGELDALRLMQAGAPNVIAMGGASMNEATAKLLRARGISGAYYVPDLEYTETGERRTDLTRQAVDAFLSAKVEGEPVLNYLYVAELPTPDGANLNGLKIDADSYGKTHGGEALRQAVELGAVTWWEWETAELLRWAKQQDAERGGVDIAKFQDAAAEIYARCTNPFERQRIRDHVSKGADAKIYAAFGVTAEALADRDEWNRNREYNNRTKALAADLAKAVEDGANPATVGDIVAKLADVQATNTRDEWETQLNQTYADELAEIANQPDTLETKWRLGKITPAKTFVQSGVIEFWPADITVFCAPTSHGKTMILFQSVLDLIARTDKTYLYVSCEENKRQLTERALNVYLDIPTTENGRDGNQMNGAYCFIKGTRKKAIKAVLRNAAPPDGYGPDFMGSNEHYDALAARVRAGVTQYGRTVRDRLKLIHTEATAEGIAANVYHYVEQLRTQGVEVGAVFVDYMQLLTSDGKSFSRHDELKDVCKALKACAARTELPVIIAAQLNREAVKADAGIDTITEANIAEGADIERIAHDIYLVWQVDRTKRDQYTNYVYPKGADGKPDKTADPVAVFDLTKMGDRSKRIFQRDEMNPQTPVLKAGHLYVERMKARDGVTGCWALLPFDAERGKIYETDTRKMAE